MLIEEVEIWFQDETRVGQQGSISRTWFYKGKRPRLVRQQQFLSAYIFGAVCPQKDKAVAFLSPVCNTGSMQIHLNIISESVEGHAVIVLDGAGWHSAKSLIIPKNILDKIYEQEKIFLEYYYEPEEINQYKGKWYNRLTAL